MNTHVIKQIIALEHKSLEELRALYKKLLPGQPALSTNRQHLIPKLVYRIQELDQGGISEETANKLSRIAKGAKIAQVRAHTNLLPGTKLCREYNGVMHEVEISKTGFTYQGQPYKSLSAIARKITGTRWNGLAFFKLK